jgi:hypothetical protein
MCICTRHLKQMGPTGINWQTKRILSQYMRRRDVGISQRFRRWLMKPTEIHEQIKWTVLKLIWLRILQWKLKPVKTKEQQTEASVFSYMTIFWNSSISLNWGMPVCSITIHFIPNAPSTDGCELYHLQFHFITYIAFMILLFFSKHITAPLGAVIIRKCSRICVIIHIMYSMYMQITVSDGCKYY